MHNENIFEKISVLSKYGLGSGYIRSDPPAKMQRDMVFNIGDF